MQIFIAADHRGFELKNKLVEYLQSQNIRVEDLGNYEYDRLDDAPIFAEHVAHAIEQNPTEHRGIAICGSGVAMSITLNRYISIRCALALNADHIKSARQHNQINAVALGAEYITIEEAKEIVDTFLSTSALNEPKYLRRIEQMNMGCGETPEEKLPIPFSDIA